METKQTYSFDEAFQASLAYFGGDELAARVWVNKYAMKDSFEISMRSRQNRCIGALLTR